MYWRGVILRSLARPAMRAFLRKRESDERRDQDGARTSPYEAPHPMAVYEGEDQRKQTSAEPDRPSKRRCMRRRWMLTRSRKERLGGGRWSEGRVNDRDIALGESTRDVQVEDGHDRQDAHVAFAKDALDASALLVRLLGLLGSSRGPLAVHAVDLFDVLVLHLLLVVRGGRVRHGGRA